MTGANGNGHPADLIDRRHPEPEPVQVDPEAAGVVMGEAERLAPIAGVRQAAYLAFQAGLRIIRQRARRGAFFPVNGGEERLEGVHPADVQVGLAVINRYGGLAVDGCRTEEIIARTIAAVDASRIHRAVGLRDSYRHGDPRTARIADQVAQRLAARTIVAQRQR